MAVSISNNLNVETKVGFWPSIAETANKIVLKKDGVFLLTRLFNSISKFALATFAKNSEFCIKLQNNVLSIFECWSCLSLINRIYEWSTRTFKTWQKFASKVFMTASNLIGTIVFWGKIGLYDLGKIALSAGAFSSILSSCLQSLSFIREGLLLASLSFSIWDRGSKILETNEKSNNAKKKLEKWSAKPDISLNFETEKNKLLEKYQIKLSKIYSEKEISDYKTKKIQKLEKYIQEIAEGKTESMVVNQKYKIEMYAKIIKTQELKKAKSWLSIACDILRVFLLTMGIIVVMTNISTLAGTIVALAALGLISDLFGCSKFLCNQFLFDKDFSKRNNR